ncbi:16S rRNA (cytosine(1402)-N(4))-methyltransferase RsmH [bacterium]|jgi:16S rRNA (cytosine1402-N4)-methyltransferase|nr:16S rRNA (cytosine(1402)-N(4))-methyltransferase RsmH [bacterium]
MTKFHIPVLYDEVVSYASLLKDDIVLDATIGYGGHSSGLLDQLGPKGRLIGVDRDEHANQFCQDRFADDDRVTLVHDRFDRTQAALERMSIKGVNVLLADLGISSYHLDHAQRSFSFKDDAPIDMRMDLREPLTGAEILNTYSHDELVVMLDAHTDLKNVKRIADFLITKRQASLFVSCADLNDVAKRAFSFCSSRRHYINCLSQLFQAIRMEVNDELGCVERLMSQLPEIILPGGRVLFITFHSIEDRLVKRYFQSQKDLFERVTASVIQLTYAQAKKNPRARSAKLRVYKRKTVVEEPRNRGLHKPLIKS